MKKPQSVIDAEIARDAVQKELTEAKELVEHLEHLLSDARKKVKMAQADEDLKMPQCKMLMASRWGGRTSEEDVTVVRVTPIGMIVVKRTGNNNSGEIRFKKCKYSGEYISKNGRFESSARLVNLPPELFQKS